MGWLGLVLALAGCSGDKDPPGDSVATDSADSDGGDSEGGDSGADTAPGDTAPPPDPATVPLGGSCAMEVDLGGFVVEALEDGANVDGKVADGVVPSAVLELVTAEGDCTIHRQLTPYCDPPCEAGDTCTFEGECVPYPENQDLGTVSVSGLVEPVELEPLVPGYTYYNTSLPSPPFEPGALVTLEMPGGTYGPQTLYGVGVEPLTGLEEEWLVESGVDKVITWDPPAGGARSRVRVRMSIDQHGATPGRLECVFEDTGTGTVPGAILAALVDAGVTGFPSASARRFTADQADLGVGCMDLEVSAPVDVGLDVANYTPCLADEDCPKGEDCNEELQICE